MIELNGKFNTAKVFTNNIDSETISQIINLLNQPYMEDLSVRIMPDCHAGAGCVIGTTIQLKDKVVPNLVGVDIGCGMLSLKLKESEIDFQKLDEVIQKYVPSGFNVHDEAIAKSNIDKCIAPVNIDNAFKSLGSLGGGNHFIEVDKDENDDLWLVIHTGSRHLGIEICNYYQNLAYDTIKNGDVRKEGQDLIEKLKREGRQSEIEKTLKDLYKKERECKIPKELCYIEGDNFKNYIHDMHLAQEHAKINRQTIADQIVKHMDFHVDMQFDTIHNYIDIDNMILRKGSISAQKGEKVIIPMNMRDGSLICIGKGNPDWNYSAPHGAGRILSRSKAKEEVDLDDFKETMKGIYTSCVNYSTLDESPFVYKPADEIKENIQDTVEIISCIKPIYNFKAHDEVDKNLQVETDIEDELEL